MYLKIDEEKIKEIEEISMTDYEAKLGYIHSDNLMSMIDDLLCEIHNLQGKVRDLEKEIDEDYEPKKINYYEEFGVSQKDFI